MSELDLSAEIWTAAHIAKFLQMEPSTVERGIICLPNFPRGFRPTGKRRGERRWFAADVRDWARKAA